MQLNGAEIVIECLKEQGVDTVFGYPGGAILNVYDELYKHRDEIRRFSGASRGASIGHVSPEAAVGGPIALVEEGDIIKINIPELKLELDVSDEELAARKAKWQPREPKVKTGYLARYASMVTSGNRGAILEVPKAK